MPVEIIPGPSDERKGEINVDDVQTIINDFRNLVVISSESPRNIKKVHTISLSRDVLLALLEPENNDDYINVHFGVTLPGQMSCADDFNTDISDQITVLINRAELVGEDLVDKLNVGDYVVTVGFRSKIAAVAPVCCGKPTGGSSGKPLQ